MLAFILVVSCPIAAFGLSISPLSQKNHRSKMALLLLWTYATLFLASFCAATAVPKQPNIILVLTDDQDLHLNSLDYQPRLQKRLRDEGTFFRKHYCTTAVCCPSRVTLLTGKLAHNTNVTDVQPPYGESSQRHLLTKLTLESKRWLSQICPAGFE